jgi:hypothetical protein
MRRSLAIAVVLAVLGMSAGVAQADPTAPIVVGSWPTGVTTESVNLRAEIDPGELPTTYLFEYTTEATFRTKGFVGATKFPQTGVGIGTGLVLKHLGELTAATSYRFRVVATNTAGVTIGATRSFETTESEPLFSLPDGRGWEMVSPIDKNGGEIQGVGANQGGGVFQAAAQGGAITYTSASSFATPQGSPGPNQYLSTRSAGEWTTENLTLPMLSGTYPESPTSGVPYQLFSSSLAGALVSNGRRCRVSTATACPVENAPLPGSGAPAGYRNYYLRAGAGSFKALISGASISGLPLDSSHFELGIAGATPDLAHVILSSCAKLTPDATEVGGVGGECDPTMQNLYEWSGGGPTLINLLPGEGTGTPGAVLAAQGGAISANGQRVYFTLGAGGPIYLRELGGPTRLLPETEGGGASFQTASADGSLAFFIAAGHLYRYTAAGETVTDLTPGGEVLGVLGASLDGTFVYYRTPAGLFLSRNGVNTAISPQVDPQSTPPSTGNARVGADGRHLLFVSTAELSAYDNRNPATGNPEPEVYLFTPAGTAGAGIVCVSCNPSGERPTGPAGLPGASPNGSGPLAQDSYKPRDLSADAKRVFFDSDGALAIGDTNGAGDVYQWEAAGSGTCVRPSGCINLISSGRAEGGAAFLDASADGSDAFFLTDGPLVASDVGGVDVYDARVGGGLPTSSSAIPCFGDACQALPPEPENPSLGTSHPRKSGNLAPPVSKAHTCKKNEFKKHGKCVKRKTHGKKAKSHDKKTKAKSPDKKAGKK